MSDLLTGNGYRRDGIGVGEKATLWVCDQCFKYMRDGASWEFHMVSAMSLFILGSCVSLSSVVVLSSLFPMRPVTDLISVLTEEL